MLLSDADSPDGRKWSDELKKIFAISLACAAFTLLIGAHSARAEDWGLGDGGGRDHKIAPAPAPLLAAGIPAFAALGGFVGLQKLRSRFRRRG